MRAALLLAPGKIEIHDVAPPELAAGEVLIQPVRAGICGSDVSFYLGHRPLAYPCVLGHEVVGRVVAVAGCGVIGLLLIQAAVRQGVRVLARDRFEDWRSPNAWAPRPCATQNPRRAGRPRRSRRYSNAPGRPPRWNWLSMRRRAAARWCSWDWPLHGRVLSRFGELASSGHAGKVHAIIG